MRPDLILVHGAVLNGAMWNPVVAALGGEFRVHAPDLPGHGSRGAEPFLLARAIDVVADLARSLAPTPVLLAGDSLGGYVSIAVAGSLGGQLAGAVLGGCTASFRGPTMLLYQAQIAMTRLIPADTLRKRLEASITKDYPAAGAAILARGIRAAAYAEAVRELRRFDHRAALAAIAAPVLLVNGTRDLPHRWGEQATLAAAPRATLRHLDREGHGVSLRRPTEFAALIRERAMGAG